MTAKNRIWRRCGILTSLFLLPLFSSLQPLLSNQGQTFWMTNPTLKTYSQQNNTNYSNLKCVNNLTFQTETSKTDLDLSLIAQFCLAPAIWGTVHVPFVSQVPPCTSILATQCSIFPTPPNQRTSRLHYNSTYTEAHVLHHIRRTMALKTNKLTIFTTIKQMGGTSLVWKVQQACPSETRKAMSIIIPYRRNILLEIHKCNRSWRK